ncbi:MAG TPA: Ig-like domain-containing protein, partial [Verrucomicrobiae bacterium]|nr:Ig-like domain-containing protein [Verrucomicrobiae bacterium]
PVANTTGTATITVTVNDGQAQNNVVTRTFTVTVSAAAPQAIYVEAESGTRTGPMVAGANANASNGQYIYSQTANQGTVSFPVNISQAGDYWVWGRVLSANSWTDSFYVSVDGGTEVTYLTAQNTWSSAWQWTKVNASGSPRSYALSQGTHTIVFRGREASTFLDALYITKDPNFVPPTGGSNLAPTLNALGNVTLNEDAPQQTVNLSGIGSGAASEIQTLTVTASSSNPGLIPAPAIAYTSPNTTGTLRFTPVANGSGTATLTVTVNDGQTSNNTVSRTFTVTVNAVNDPPAISNISDRSTTVNVATAAIPFTVSDAETAAGSLTLSKGSSNPTLVPANNIVFGGSGANRTVTVTPAAGQTGNATITVTVSDGALSASDSFVLTVNSSAPATRSFTNAAAITIPGAGSANPYPSTINVSGTAGTVSQVTVGLRSLNHTWPADVDVLLVGPGGQKAVIFSDVGGGGDLSNVTVTLSDGAATGLTATGQIVSGTYRPSNVEPGELGELDAFPAPAPGGPYGSAALSVFNGLSANGTWSLYVVDDGAGDQGSIAGGWSLTITTTSSVGPAAVSAIPPRMTAIEVVNGARVLTVTGEVGGIYEVEASSDLINWIRVGSGENTSGAVTISDTVPGYPVRFYRAVSVALPVGAAQD